MRTLILMAVCAAGLSGCATQQNLDAPMSPEFGRAVASMETQIIPVRVSDQPPASSGAVGTAAVNRYLKGEVYKPETQSTSNVVVVGGGGGKSSSGK